ncbi:MepB protein [Serratia quinivorans]|uniref:MepB family protein n=1 Tax=Serratia quinivorans TaxID=137545 RepID=UPI000D99BC85|nr:MepB family protein [Serratia quinivorans]SPZ65749.1 MepB protein [Serratia quinivorans]VEI74123.1 MepB protein [Serratia quinivorans]
MLGSSKDIEGVWFADPAKGKIPVQLSDIINDVLLPAGIRISEPQRESESSEYGACQFEVEGKRALFRVANTTPTKLGQFVTMWKRPHIQDEIMPIDFDDGIEFVLVSVFDHTHRGFFIFNRHALAKKGVMSVKEKEGKRAIRVYAPWVKPIVKQAITTQKWQLQYFVPVTSGEVNANKLKALLTIDSLF